MADTEKNIGAEEGVAAETTASVAESSVPTPKKQKKAKKDKKPNFFVRLGRRLAKFVRDYNSERKKISWKPWREVCKSALIVVVTVTAFSLVIFGLDTAFGTLFSWLGGLV